MNKKTCYRVISSILNHHWAIRPDALEMIMSIAQRSLSDKALALSQAEQYQTDISGTEVEQNIAIIDVIGPIFARADLFSEISGATSHEGIMHSIQQALDDPNVSSIMLRFDSPGGQVTGTHELANFIFESRDIKPIVSYVSGACCSAAYWIASATSYIYADKTSQLGSIGVVAAWTDDKAAKAKQGLIDYEVVSSQSPDKRLDPATDKGKKALQKELDALADIFISDVSSFRGVSKNTVLAKFGKGGTFLAESAIDVGMADELGSFREVVLALSEQNDSVVINEKQGDSNMARFKSKRKFAASKKANEQLPPEEEKELEDENLDEEAENEDEEILGEDALPEDEQAESDDEEHSAIDEDEPEAIEDEDEEEAAEEDEESETTATNRRLNQFARKNPTLYTAILRRGARRERSRIEGIEALSAKGREKIINTAKFDNPKSIAATVRQIARSEKKRKIQALSDYSADASFKTPVASTGRTSSSESIDKSLLEQIKLGANIKGGR